MPAEREDPTEKIERPSEGGFWALVVLHLFLTPEGQLVFAVLFTVIQQFRRALRNTLLSLFEGEFQALLDGAGLLIGAIVLGAVVGLVSRKKRG